MPPSVLQRIAAGDPTAAQDCIDCFGGLVWHLARRTLHSRADLDDAVQEVFVELWKAASKFDPNVASERSFIAMIARRRLIDRGRRERTRIASTVNAGDFDSTFSRSSNDEAPSRPMERREESAMAAAAIRRLSPEQQQALRMSIYDGLSHQEISDKLNMPLGTVKTNLRRGLIRIREMLAQQSSSTTATMTGEVMP